jgi:Response regulator containing CheY-like receiver, AAA-type ATPase, and DNA-binding domains
MTDTQTYQILAVDDEIANINFYKVALSRLPIAVDTATSGAEAFELLQQKQYDLVLLDLLMPGVTGIGLLQKAEREGLTLPIVLVCSSVSDKSVISQALSLGAGGYLTKPFTYQQLLQAVCDYLNLPLPQTGVKVSTPIQVPIQPAPKMESNFVGQSSLNSTSSQKEQQTFASGKVESLTRAMSAMTIHKKTGKIEVHTASGMGVLEYEKGRLKSVIYDGKTSIDALEALRLVSHRAVHVELNN